ncbi:hypothetical protein D3C71_1581410 [compost metagenome]
MRRERDLRPWLLTLATVSLVAFVVLAAFVTRPQCPGASEATWTNRGWLCVVEVG